MGRLLAGWLLFDAAPAGAFELVLDPATLPPNQTIPVTLKLTNDTGAGPSAPGQECHQGAGDEVCAWDVKITGVGGVAFPPNSVDIGTNDVVFNQRTPTEILANGGDPIVGQRGTQTLFSFMVTTGTGGAVQAEAKWVDSSLGLQQFPTTAIAQVSADGDGDGVPDDKDACPTFSNGLPLRDRNGDNIPDDCNCGDATGDGTINVLDSRRIKQCSVQLRNDCDPDISDADGSGTINVLDARRVDQVVVLLRQSWQLTCARRPQETEPPPFEEACATPGVSCEPVP
jgi:hypothetical protein